MTRITGFDFNTFKTVPTCSDFLDVIKYSFDQRLEGNRSPFTVNAHTDYYSEYYDPVEFGCKDHMERRQAIEDFIDHARQSDQVFIVPYYRVIRWMRDPVTVDEMKRRGAE